MVRHILGDVAAVERSEVLLSPDIVDLDRPVQVHRSEVQRDGRALCARRRDWNDLVRLVEASVPAGSSRLDIRI